MCSEGTTTHQGPREATHSYSDGFDTESLSMINISSNKKVQGRGEKGGRGIGMISLCASGGPWYHRGFGVCSVWICRSTYSQPAAAR
jgi:hypothetical protein